ncbi:TRAP transporter subunit DctM [Escherichia coli]|nr:TRAP transporter subunit DctM [Escherichia coli]
MMTKTQINKLIKMMNDLDYPFEAPLKESFIESIIQIEFNSNSTNCLEKLCNEVSILFKNQPDGNDSNLLIVFYVQIMPDDFVMQLHRF